MGRRTNREIAGDISRQQSQLAHTSGLGSAGVDPAYVPDREVFNGYTHQQIWDQVHEKIDIGALGQVADGWQQVGIKLWDLFDAFAKEVRSEFASWSGAFASAAQQSTDAFVRAGNEAHDTTRTVYQLMSLNASAAMTVKNSIPQPPEPYKPSTSEAWEAAHGGTALRQWQERAAALEAEAQDAMTYLYNPTLPASGDSVPRYVSPAAGPTQPGDTGGPGFASDGDGPGGVGGTGGQGDGVAQSKDGQSGDQGQAGEHSQPGDQQQGEGAQSTQPSATGGAESTKPSSLADGGSGGGSGAGATSGEAARTSPAGVVAGGSGPGYGGGVGSAGGGRGGAGGGRVGGVPGGEGPAGPGRSVPGQPLSTAAQAAAVARGMQAAGMVGVPMGAMPVGRRDAEDEQEKQSPDYLRRQYEELSELPPAMTPVIGADVVEGEKPTSSSSDGAEGPRGDS
ncbi:hypothetical protein [Nocardia transvalensis]|uniref:hypothetical protein n=1 Tax=Nocardia transvalensis TaxID=37333 RepID=UPI0018952CF2|nr:hypothetical protein [Nocardia transvalensis]MBF6329101.1 hypothetical protein [Nocardia transvalensis]